MTRGRKDYEKAVIAVESEGFQDPHGRILMYDSFENPPLKWTGIGTGTWFVSRQAAAAYNDGFGLRLDLTATTPPATDVAFATRLIPIDVTERLLEELFWRANDLTRLHSLEISLDYYDGNTRHYAGIRYNTAAGYWEYWTAAGAWAEIIGSNQVFFNNGWNEFTLSCDFATNEYIIFKSNNIEINMGGIPCWNPGSFLGAHVIAEVTAWNATTDQLLVSVDDVVVRELET